MHDQEMKPPATIDAIPQVNTEIAFRFLPLKFHIISLIDTVAQA